MTADAIAALVPQFERLAIDGQTLTFAARGVELQEAACQDLESFLERLATEKTAAAREGDDEAANTVLSMELSLGTVLHELRMWIDLKRDAPESAWDHLITAEGLCEDAISVRRQLQGRSSTEGLEGLMRKLLLLERLVFPPQVFTSFGGTVGQRECSICGRSYDECDHIKGRAYMGQPCHTILHDIRLEEVSIVTDPANKRARVTHFSDGGQMRNKMTWRLENRGDSSTR